MSVIKTENLTKIYRMGHTKIYALDHVNLSFEKGEFAGLVGPSGSGKTTFLNMVGILDKPTEGRVIVMEKETSSLNQKEAALFRRKYLGFIFQTFNLFPHYTAFENVEFPLLLLDLSTEERKERVMEALEMVNLAHRANSKPSELSGGERQRVAIARAIVKRPEIILADEPTANLDAKNSYNVLDIMADINEKLKATFIFATHDEKVIKYLRRKITLNDGKVVKDEVMK